MYLKLNMVYSSTTTSLICDVTEAPTGSYDVRVHVAGIGYADWGSVSDDFAYTMTVDTITPTTGM